MHFFRGALGIAAALTIAAAMPSLAAGDEGTPRRGGTFEFAVAVEPDDYDCHDNTSFSFLHPVAPHYSTLLKFDAPRYPQIIGDLAASWSISDNRQTYTFQASSQCLLP
jgi:peptide/nickel transport system substrate-binding protein